MEKDFAIEFRLSQVSSKIQALLPTLTEEFLRGARMSTVEAQSISGEDSKKRAKALLRLSNDDFSLNLHVIADSLVEISMAASKFNMASAHGCSIKLFLNEDCLKVHFTPPSENIARIIADFFEIASSSIPS